MLQSLEDVVQRLVERYDPDRVILFGSRADGHAAEDSDVDLLVIKDTPLGSIQRRAEVDRMLLDRQFSLDVLVYTPREMRELYLMGSPLIEGVVETGRVLYMRKATAAWLGEAEDEQQAGAVLLENRHYRASCFHSQQCVEKGLKAILLEAGERPPRTHDIIALLKDVRDRGHEPSLTMDDAVWLNNVYRGRYPTEEGLLPHGEPEEGEARRVSSAAERFIADLRRTLVPGP